MHPPPPSVTLLESPSNNAPAAQHLPSHKSHFRSLSPHPSPFVYEYVFQEGKMPFLAELHPVKTKDVKATRSTQQTHLHSSSAIQKQRSLKQKEKQLHFDLPTGIPAMQAWKKETEKLKRAFSLSGLKSSTQSKALNPELTDVKSASPPMRNDSTRSAPPAISLPVPSLILPTPSPSPNQSKISDEFRHSMHSNNSSSYRSVNFSLPRSSWASSTDEEDQMDLQFVRETAQGRFSPHPAPTFGMRRNKALAILGISEMPITPPYTPSHSAAPSIYDIHSRIASRRTSVEHPLSRHHSISKEKPLLNYPSLDKPSTPPQTEPLETITAKPSTPEGDKTPKPSKQSTNGEITENVSPLATPRPSLKRKTSKFIEHIDNTPQNPRLAPLLIPIAKSEISPFLVPPPTRKLPQSPGLHRSTSMKVPSPRPSPWGSVVCTAEARPIIAMGNARLITSGLERIQSVS